MPPHDKPTSTPPDLTPYKLSQADQFIGLEPVAVGFLNGRPTYPQGQPPAQFVAQLFQFCQPHRWVNVLPTSRPCPFCPTPVPPLEANGQTHQWGTAEIRVIGEEDIFAAPTLIYHYVTVHHYLPPTEFITAVLSGPAPASPEYRALIRALR